MKKPSRAFLIRIAVLAALFGGVCLAWMGSRESIATYLLGEIERYSARELPVKISARGLTIRLISPMAELSDVVIEPKPGLLDGLGPIRLARVRANLDFLQILGGRIYLSSLVLEKPTLELDVDELTKGPDTNPEIPWDKIFLTLRKIPVFRFAIFDMAVGIEAKKAKVSAKIDPADVLIVNQRDRLTVDLQVNRSDVTYDGTIGSPLTASMNFLVSKQGITIHSTEIETLESRLSVSGSLNLPRRLADTQGALTLQTVVKLEKLSPLMAKLFKKAPPMQGEIEITGRADLAPRNHGGRFQVKTRAVEVDDFIIGEIVTQGSLTNGLIEIPKINWKHDVNEVVVEDFKFNTAEPYAASFAGHVEGLDVHEFLIQVTAGDVPVEMILHGKAKCEGAIKPSFVLDCTATAEGENLEVRADDDPKSTIVLIDKFTGDGKLRVDEEQVTFEAKAGMGANTGTTKGFVHYDKGFVIDFATPRLEFGNVHSLAGLEIAGAAKITGSTRGDSDAATFYADFEAEDVTFEKFHLGNPKGRLSYAKGSLFFDKLQGNVNESRYLANVTVDVLHERVRASGSAKGARIEDLLRVFRDIIVLPMDLTGFADIDVTTEGPLDFSRLSYRFNSRFTKVGMLGESIDAIDFNVVSNKGEVHISKAEAVKANGRLIARGVAHPDGQTQMTFSSQNILLEDSQNVTALDSNISGRVAVQGKISGHVLRPTVLVDTYLSNLVIDEQEFADSKAIIGVNPLGVLTDMNLFGGRLLANLQIPLNPEAPFLLDLHANDWNYTTIFAIIGGGRFLSEYEAELSGHIRLQSDQGGLFAATGEGTIESFLLKRGSLSLQNSGQMELNMKSGVASLKNFRLRGPGSVIDVTGEAFSRTNLDLGVQGDLDLRLIQIFLPFLDELAGRANVRTQLSGPLEKPEILGSVSIKNGFVKVKNFPHAFEKIESEAQFSRTRVSIARLGGFLAGGQIEGSGDVLLNGYRDFPVDIKATLTGANLNVPAGVQTYGFADLRLTGNWFPFTLSGTYDIERGHFSREFAEETGQNAVQQSSYLPKLILKSAFEPLLLDLRVNVERGFTVRNAHVDGAATGNLRVRGVPSSPRISGQVQAERDTKLLFRDKVFEASVGQAKFTEGDVINPEIYVTARSRIQDYDINLLVQGTARDPKLRLTSLPPLAETDIYTLLALGVTSSKLENDAERARDNETARNSTIQKALIEATPVGKVIEDSLGLQFQYSSSYDADRNIAAQKYTFSRQLSDRLRGSLSRGQGQYNSNEAQLNYKIDQNWSAVGTVESREGSETTTVQDRARDSQTIFGLDLDFRREFR